MGPICRAHLALLWREHHSVRGEKVGLLAYLNRCSSVQAVGKLDRPVQASWQPHKITHIVKWHTQYSTIKYIFIVTVGMMLYKITLCLHTHVYNMCVIGALRQRNNNDGSLANNYYTWGSILVVTRIRGICYVIVVKLEWMQGKHKYETDQCAW